MKLPLLSILISLLFFNCNSLEKKQLTLQNTLPSNILDYTGIPLSKKDRTSLSFSDQGAWFSYGLPEETVKLGFSGPFLMTQENGVWSSKILSELTLTDLNTQKHIPLQLIPHSQKSYLSHLEQSFSNNSLKVNQLLFFSSPHSALIKTSITNISKQPVTLSPQWIGNPFSDSLTLNKENAILKITSKESTAIGYIQALNSNHPLLQLSKNSYSLDLENLTILPNQSKELILSQTFIFPKYDLKKEQENLNHSASHYIEELQNRITEKELQFNLLCSRKTSNWSDSIYNNLIAKSLLTLQNNWRISAGELKHSGIFPSYHYTWFNGFWAWDSWKHAVAVAQYNPTLAKDQIKALYDFQEKNGFIPDCLFRDTLIEKHNYRNTKPPLSAWAIWKTFEQDHDLDFLKELYPKIVKQHQWWYLNRDHDQDGICEYGSTDGTLIAAKWESGMDNAVRFDDSQLLKNNANAYSLNQESVDLNAYLFAEKKYLQKIAIKLQLKLDIEKYREECSTLKKIIQKQFYDPETGWFYDTNIDGTQFIKTMGCEGWIPLWANVATPEQAKSIKENMMNEKLFNTYVPLPTLSASHPDFNPNGGYWRGPNWIDQVYFGIKGLQNYSYQNEAQKLTYKTLHNAKGLLPKGNSIRENYHPLTGEGLEAENFSWSAAHFLLLLINES